jgi:hypothetical protein
MQRNGMRVASWSGVFFLIGMMFTACGERVSVSSSDAYRGKEATPIGYDAQGTPNGKADTNTSATDRGAPPRDGITPVDRPLSVEARDPESCLPGEKKWCAGTLQYDGWSIVECNPVKMKWNMIFTGSGYAYDCHELSEDRRPNTMCACYHFYANSSCCETPDCVIPAGTDGQICPPSPGNICDYCNPQKSECKEPGAKCLVTNTHETFCGRDCSTQVCPTGYVCQTITLQTGTAHQCVPDDFSCYY